jgi:bacterioferritin
MATGIETSSVLDYNGCARNADSATKKIFEALVDDDERHLDQ